MQCEGVEEMPAASAAAAGMSSLVAPQTLFIGQASGSPLNTPVRGLGGILSPAVPVTPLGSMVMNMAAPAVAPVASLPRAPAVLLQAMARDLTAAGAFGTVCFFPLEMAAAGFAVRMERDGTTAPLVSAKAGRRTLSR